MPNNVQGLNGDDRPQRSLREAQQIAQQPEPRVGPFERDQRQRYGTRDFDRSLPHDVQAERARPPRSENRPPRGMFDAFVKVCHRWHLDESAQVALLGFGKNPTYGQRIIDGLITLPSQDIEDRVGYVVGIAVGLVGLFGDNVDGERAWLNRARSELRGKSPLALMLDGKMPNLAEVSDLLLQERGL